MRLAEHPFYTRERGPPLFNHCINFSTCPSSRRQPLPRCHRQDFWRTRLILFFRFVLRGIAKSNALNSPVNQAIMQTFDIAALLILNGRVEIHGKLRTMTPISLHRQKSKYECTFSVSQRARKIITSSPSWIFSGAVARMEGKASLGETTILLIIRENG